MRQRSKRHFAPASTPPAASWPRRLRRRSRPALLVLDCRAQCQDQRRGPLRSGSWQCRPRSGQGIRQSPVAGSGLPSRSACLDRPAFPPIPATASKILHRSRAKPARGPHIGADPTRQKTLCPPLSPLPPRLALPWRNAPALQPRPGRSGPSGSTKAALQTDLDHHETWHPRGFCDFSGGSAFADAAQ